MIKLRPVRPVSHVPSSSFVSSVLRNQNLVAGVKVIVPYLDCNLEFVVELPDQPKGTAILVDQRTHFEIVVSWTDCYGLLMPNEIEHCQLDVDSLVEKITKRFKGQSELVRVMLTDISNFCSKRNRSSLKPSKVVNLVGQSGAGKSAFASTLKAAISETFVEIVDCTKLEQTTDLSNREYKPGILILENSDFINAYSCDFESFEAKLVGSFKFYVEKLLSTNPIYCIVLSDKQLDKVWRDLPIDQCFWLAWNSAAQSQELLQHFGGIKMNTDFLAQRLVGFLPCEIAYIVALLLVSKDTMEHVIRANYPARLGQQRLFLSKSNVVVGMNEVKSKLCFILDGFVKHSKVHCKGFILFGPTGTGKTLLLSQLAREYFQLGLNFVFVDATQIRSKYLGNSEKALRDVFERTKSAPKTVLVFDQIDSLFSKRISRGSNRLVNCLLREMDENQYALVIGVAQELSNLDEALLRPGRLFPHIRCANLDAGEREQFLLQPKYPLQMSDSQIDDIVNDTAGFTGAQMHGLLQQAALHALQRSNFKDCFVEFNDFQFLKQSQ